MTNAKILTKYHGDAGEVVVVQRRLWWGKGRFFFTAVCVCSPAAGATTTPLDP